MQYSTAPVSTLYINVRFRKSPYSNKIIALRLTANFYEDFKHNNVLLMREINPDCNLIQLNAVINSMQKDAHAASVFVNMPNSVANLFKNQN